MATRDNNVVALRRQDADAQRVLERLQKTGGGGTFDGMDPWQTSVETRLGQIHGSVEKLDGKLDTKSQGLADKIDSNFKWLIGAYGAGFVALAGMAIASYLLLAEKIGSLAH